jgi:hypothetical protein
VADSDEIIDPASEDGMRARADLVVLLTRCVLTAADVCPAFVADPPLARSVQLDVTTGRIPRRRAIVYDALFADAREWLDDVQEAAAQQIVPGGLLTVRKALQPWLLAFDKSALHPTEFQDCRSALARYLSNVREVSRDYIPGIEETIAAKWARRAVRPARYALERTQKEATRLAGALELYALTRVSVRQLLRSADSPAEQRRKTPLSDGEAAIALRIYREKLAAPL